VIQSNMTITMNFSRFMVQELDSFFLFSSLVEKLTCCLRLLCMPSKFDLFFFLSSAGKAYAANQLPINLQLVLWRQKWGRIDEWNRWTIPDKFSIDCSINKRKYNLPSSILCNTWNLSFITLLRQIQMNRLTAQFFGVSQKIQWSVRQSQQRRFQNCTIAWYSRILFCIGVTQFFVAFRYF
jgi:hypothetical protein